MVTSTDRSKADVPVLILLFVALWFILRGDVCEVLPYVILFMCFSVLLALQLPRLGKSLSLVLFVRLFDLRLLVLSVFSSSWCLGRAVVCGTPWTFLLPLFFNHLFNLSVTSFTVVAHDSDRFYYPFYKLKRPG